MQALYSAVGTLLSTDKGNEIAGKGTKYSSHLLGLPSGGKTSKISGALTGASIPQVYSDATRKGMPTAPGKSPTAPVADAQTTRTGKRRATARTRAGQGRAGTILSGDKLG